MACSCIVFSQLQLSLKVRSILHCISIVSGKILYDFPVANGKHLKYTLRRDSSLHCISSCQWTYCQPINTSVAFPSWFFLRKALAKFWGSEVHLLLLSEWERDLLAYLWPAKDVDQVCFAFCVFLFAFCVIFGQASWQQEGPILESCNYKITI